MKKFFADFKAFIMKGNIIDMAVGVVIGGAFGKIVTSLVNDIITPLISILTGKVSITELKWVINEAVLAEDGVTVVTPELALTYGNFIQNIIDFLIIAVSIFVVLRVMTAAHKKLESLKKKEEEEKKEEAPKETELSVLCEIREMLKKQNGEGEEEKE
ncbi:MAG: large-conductance mechanosensitive channel protein MscL [Clostridia bacterium]|nr:large-conductance mechanosensitive channel protein MscL [Clostridia bacterium]